MYTSTRLACLMLPMALASFTQSSYGQGEKIYWVDAFTEKVQRANFEIPSEETPSSRTDVEDLVVVDLDRPFGIAIDPTNQYVYWTDYVTRSISRARLDGTETTVIVSTGMKLPGGIAIDTKGGKLYWVDAGTDKLQRCNLDGSMIEDLVTKGLSIPTAVALDLSQGHVYWSDIGNNTISRATLNGENITPVITSGLGSPVSIAVDAVNGKLYWSDTRPYSGSADSHIKRTNLDGTGEEIIAGGTSPFRIFAGIAVDPIAQKIYWTDAQLRRITRANLDGTNEEDMLTSGLHAPQGIAIFRPGK
ncbi:MAG: SMP-30/gluconolactonase/LRE family protein [Phycisphaerae bacterium]